MKVILNISNTPDIEMPLGQNFTINSNLSNFIPIGKSGIHIKEKNKGSFTSYCGGKVTTACINKAKNSPNPAIRKKAVFADNARHWARKHQFGGELEFAEYTPFEGVGKSILNKFGNSKDILLDDLYNIYPQTPITSNKEVEEVPQTSKEPWWKNPYHSSVIGSTTSSNLQNAIKDYLDIKFQLGGKGKSAIDCSGFTSAVMQSLGKNVTGTAKDQYNQSQHINLNEAKVGDLIFLQDTQPKARKHGEGSHVAIITDTSKLKEGIVGVAEASSSAGKTKYSTWNLNSGFHANHFLGVGRV